MSLSFGKLLRVGFVIVCAFVFISWLFLTSRAETFQMTTDHIASQLDGKPSDVYFFKSWATHEHPVQPIDPVHFEDALKRKGYFRAWMQGSAGSEKFVFFEGVQVLKKELPALRETLDRERHLFFTVAGPGDDVQLGGKIEPSEAVLLERFIFSPAEDDTVFVVTQIPGISYKYSYNQDESLKKVIVKGIDGKVTVLE